MALAKVPCPRQSSAISQDKRMTQTGSRGHEQRGTINYEKLKELCQGTARVGDEMNGHQQFMEQYTSIIINPKRVPHLQKNSVKKPHSRIDTDVECLFDITAALINIRGRDRKQQEIVDLNSRLKAMLNIVKKQPVQRSSTEVKELAQHFLHFPGLLPRMEMEVLVGMASRAKMEQIPKHSAEHALPGQGGVYIVLQGCVEKLTMDPAMKESTLEVLEAGHFFGELTPTKQQTTVKLSSCPSYSAKGLCTLVRLTSFNYEQVVENWETTSFSKKSDLITSCSLLQSVSPSVVTKLAEAITWETIEPKQTILAEGEEIAKVGFIQSGSCVAHVRVPRAPRPTQVTVGHLERGDCIGEGMLRGNDRQPYTIVSTTRLRVGWVTATTLRVNEVEKHILPDKKFTLTPLSSLGSKGGDQAKYARMLMDKQWRKIKEDIVHGVVTERGIRRGHSKWRHSRSHSADGSIRTNDTISKH